MTTQTIHAADHSTELSQDDLLSLYRCHGSDPPVRRAIGPFASARPDSRRLSYLRGTGGDRRRRLCRICAADDVVFSTHRGHGHALAKGVSPRQLFAELFGRATGCSQGRGGSMHLFAPETGMMGTSGIVGPCILQAAGAGYSFTLLEEPIRWPSPSSATAPSTTAPSTKGSTWPASGSCRCCSSARTTSSRPRCRSAYAAGNPSVASRGASYGMPGVDVDGNDVIAVYKAAARGRRSRPSRRRAHAARMPHLPHPAARRGDGRLHLPHPRRGRRLENSLPDPPSQDARSTTS